MANGLVPVKQDLTANMYALRAGLSVVSAEVLKGKSLMEQKKEALDKVKAEADDNLHVAKKFAEYWEGGVSDKTKYYLSKCMLILSSILLILSLGLFVYMLFFWLIPKLGGDYGDILYGWLLNHNAMRVVSISMTIASILGIGLSIFLQVWFNSSLKYYKEDYGLALEYNPKYDCIWKKSPCKHDVPSFMVTPKYVHKKYNEAMAALATTENECNAEIAAAESEYEQAIAFALQNHILPAKAMYSSLANVFSYLVDERDWANLDYLIYAIETGRADTIKEALQLLDREKQTDRIVAAIQAASREIVQLLVSGFTALSNQISSGIAMLSQQIQANSYQTAQLSARMSQIANAQTLNNALLEKANESSEQLVTDAHRIVELENMRYNRGY